MIEILHERDSDGGCDITVFVDGVRQGVRACYDVDPGAGWLREDWEARREEIANDEDASPAFRSATLSALEDASGTYIDNTDWVQLDLHIRNVYPDDVVEISTSTWAEDPPLPVLADDVDEEEQEEIDEWAQRFLFPHTGIGRDGDGFYEVTILAVHDDDARIDEPHPFTGRVFYFG